MKIWLYNMKIEIMHLLNELEYKIHGTQSLPKRGLENLL